MRIIEEGSDFAVVRIAEKDLEYPWTLFVVDDLWREIWFMFKRAGEPFDLKEAHKWRKIQRVISKKVMGFLPVYCRDLDGLQQLVIGDFPKSEGSKHFLTLFHERQAMDGNAAFLIDIEDEKKPHVNAEVPVLELLELFKIPLSRCAFLTVGTRETDFHLDTIVKRDVNKTEGLALRNWWNRMRGRVDNGIFKEQCRDVDDWHYPSRIPVWGKGTSTDEDDDAMFLGFLAQMAHLDAYGVWRWVARAISDPSASEADKRYAYLCGKAFLKDGTHNHPWFCYTALRGLLYGLARGRLFQMSNAAAPIYRSDPVTEPRSRLAPPLDGDESVPPIDQIKYYGRYSTGREGVGFADFAGALREWVETLEGSRNGKARLKSINLFAWEEECTVTLTFTHPLDDAIFGSGTGMVTAAYERLRNCFVFDHGPQHDTARLDISMSFVPEPNVQTQTGGDHENAAV